MSQVDLHRHFHSLGAGVIEEVRVQRDKGFGFVRYSTHVEAALAIQMGNTHSYLSGRQMKVKLTNLNHFFWFRNAKNFMFVVPTVFLGKQANSTRNSFKPASSTSSCTNPGILSQRSLGLREATSDEQDGRNESADASPAGTTCS